MAARRCKLFVVFVIAGAAALTAGQPGSAVNDRSDKGKELFEDLCSSCHELARATRPQFATTAEWRQLAASMLVEGNAATDQEISLIADYLMKNFGRPRRPPAR